VGERFLEGLKTLRIKRGRHRGVKGLYAVKSFKVAFSTE